MLVIVLTIVYDEPFFFFFFSQWQRHNVSGMGPWSKGLLVNMALLCVCVIGHDDDPFLIYVLPGVDSLKCLDLKKKKKKSISTIASLSFSTRK